MGSSNSSGGNCYCKEDRLDSVASAQLFQAPDRAAGYKGVHAACISTVLRIIVR